MCSAWKQRPHVKRQCQQYRFCCMSWIWYYISLHPSEGTVFKLLRKFTKKGKTKFLICSFNLHWVGFLLGCCVHVFEFQSIQSTTLIPWSPSMAGMHGTRAFSSRLKWRLKHRSVSQRLAKFRANGSRRNEASRFLLILSPRVHVDVPADVSFMPSNLFSFSFYCLIVYFRYKLFLLLYFKSVLTICEVYQ